MARMIDIDVERERIKIDFPYHREVVDVVRTLPDRWFDRDRKCWFVPLEHLNYVIRRLDDYHFKFSARLREFRNADDGRAQPAKPALPQVPKGTWTVSRLNQAARAALRERFESPIWLVGELQDFEKNRASSYPTYFFDLVERPFKGANEVAKVKAVLFERHRQQMTKKLRDNQLELADGMAVRLCGKIDLYARNGRYQIIVEDIDPAYTAGEIELNRERVYQALKKAGIEAQNRQRAWPTCPLRVGLITSYESDAYNDFVTQLRDSGRGFCVAVHHASVQGVHTERSVLKALSYFREHAQNFDVVAIVRGGGSRSELAYFDTQAIGEAVCRHPLKIICGVGHQRDQCLLDMIATSTKTPTAAAEAIAARVQAFTEAIDQCYESIARKGERKVMDSRRDLVRQAGRLERQGLRRLRAARDRHHRLRTAVVETSRAVVAQHQRQLDGRKHRLATDAQRVLQRRQRAVQRACDRLSARRMKRRFERRRQAIEALRNALGKSARRDARLARKHLAHLEEQLVLVDPRRILERGFALVRDETGLVRSRDQIPTGHDFDVIFGDGVLQARRIDDDQGDTQQREPTQAVPTAVSDSVD